MDLIKREQLFNEGFYPLDRNENLDPEYNNFVSEIVKKNSTCIQNYPDYSIFTKKLSDFLGIDFENIMITCGCTEAIKIIADYYVSWGTYVLVLEPTYDWAVKYFEQLGANIATIQSNTSVDEIINYINNNHIEIFYLCNPHHPTGTVYSEKDLRKLIDCKTIIFIDEAYCEFSKSTFIYDAIKSNNVYVGRTFSKAWGLAGLRLGLLIANEKLLKLVLPFKLKASVNNLVVKVASELLNNSENMKNSVKNILKGNLYMREGFERLGYKVYSELTVNFIYSNFPSEKLTGLKILHKIKENNTVITCPSFKIATDIFKWY